MNAANFNFLRLLIIVIFFLIFNGCSSQDNADQFGEVDKKLDKLIKAFEQTDLETHSQLWWQDDSLKVFGVYRGNNFSGWEELKIHFEKAAKKISESRIEVLNKNINFSEDGKTAWFSMLCNQYVKMDKTERELSGMRYTGVMRSIGGDWRIVQFHGSIPLNISIR
jgi:hypothetical protein